MRDIDLGRTAGLRFTTLSDVPAFGSDRRSALVRAVIDNRHLSIGFNRSWERYLVLPREQFTASRFSSKGGMMYYENVGLFRLWTPVSKLAKDELQALMLRTINQSTARYAAPSSRFSIADNYAFIDGAKYAGISANVIRDKSNCFLCVNKDALPFDLLRRTFKNKTFDGLVDLAPLAIPDSFYSEIAADLARALGESVEPSLFDEAESEWFGPLEAVHTSEAWLERAERADLTWDRSR